MGVISLKEYARIKNISYEAVRQQVTRYREELGDHVIKDGRQQFLDEEAVAFLDERRQKNPVVIYQENKDGEIEHLREERQQLLEDLNEAKSRIIAQQDRLYALAASEQKMLMLEATTKAAEERAAAAEQKAAESEKQAVTAVQRKVEAELALEEIRERAETAEQIAEMNAQEAEAAKQRADELQTQLDRLAGAGWFERRKILKDIKNQKIQKTVDN